MTLTKHPSLQYYFLGSHTCFTPQKESRTFDYAFLIKVRAWALILVARRRPGALFVDQ